MFARQRDPGLWTFDSVITGAELEYWDASIANAIDGAGGGAYSLSSDVTIGGDPFVAWVFDLQTTFNAGSIFGSTVLFSGDVTLWGLTTFDGSTVFNGAVTYQDYANFIGAADFQDNLTVFGIASLQGGVNLSGDVNVYGPTVFDAEGTFNDVVLFDDDFTVNGNAFLNGSVVLGASSTQTAIIQAKSSLRAPMTMSGTGAISHRTILGGDSDASFSPLACKDVVILSGILSGSVGYTIDDTGCLDDQEIVFINKDQTHSMAVKRPGGTTIAGITGGWVRCKRIAGTWYTMERDNGTSVL